MDDLFTNYNDLPSSINPLQVAFYASVILALSNLYILLTGGGGVLARTIESGVAYIQLGITISTMLLFMFFYLKRSIFAWWTPID